MFADAWNGHMLKPVHSQDVTSMDCLRSLIGLKMSV